MKIKMLKDSVWKINGRLKSFKKDIDYTLEEIGDNKIIANMVRLEYGVELKEIKIEDSKKMNEYENKAIFDNEIKTPKRRGRKPNKIKE